MPIYTRALLNIARVGATPLGYGADKILVQVGTRMSAARVGWARVGASAVGLTSLASHLRAPLRSGFKIVNTGRTDPPQCTLSLRLPATARPQSGNLLIVGIGTLKHRLFAGRVSSVKDADQLGDQYLYHVSALGFGKQLERIQIFETYTDEAAGDILQELFNDYTDGYQVYDFNIEDGETFDSITFDGVSLLDACNELAERSGYRFYIDHYKRVFFGPTTTETAPWIVDDTEYFNKLKIDDDSSDLRTQVIVRYSELESYRQAWMGDDEATEFALAEEPESVQGLYVDGVAVTYGSKYTEDNSGNDFAINYSEKTITNSAHATMTSSQTLLCLYMAKIPARITVDDVNARQAARSREGGTGIYSFVHEDRDILSQSDAVGLAQEMLERYSTPYYSASYTRWEDLTTFFRNRLRVGMMQQITARGWDINLEIQQITLTIYRPHEGLHLGIAQDVQLGDRRYSLPDLFKELDALESTQLNEYVRTYP